MTKGFEILERNFRSKFGEIDIIAKKSNLIVYVEVKSLMSKKVQHAGEAVTAVKIGKIRKTAHCYAALNNIYNEHRFDIIEVYLGMKFCDMYVKEFVHFENAF